ncbi:MAG: hypothetical protein QM627_10715 [Luteolibacter sp.]
MNTFSGLYLRSARQSPASTAQLAAERVLGLLPEFVVEERRMLTGKLLAPMSDDSIVKGIGSKGGDFVANEALAT